MEKNEEQLKAEAWDIAYPALVFLIEANFLPPSGWDDIRRAIKHSSQESE